MLHKQWLWAMSVLCVLAAVTGCKTVPPKDAAASCDWTLLPAPRQIEITGTSPLPREYNGACPFEVSFRLDPKRMPHPQGYEIAVAPAGRQGRAKVEVVACDAAGQFYATQTLRQLVDRVQRNGCMAACRIVDWPDFPNRGVMIDVSRTKVPEMKTLYELVDLLASWKINQFQMYTEHTFAYKNHHVVWEDSSPMTAEQVRDLDAYCKDRFVQLVPNQNSFGHMERWLSHPEYGALAEAPNGRDLCPTDPKSIDLLRDMYASLLPNFSSPYVNVGCDETSSIGKGRSKEACDAKGVGRVYLEFLMKIRELAREQGKDVQFWADIINGHPELIPELPKGMTAVEWGYEADHPFAEHCKRFKENGVRFYVAPGTSSWTSLLGRTDNSLANLLNAAENGCANGGDGYLITDWGDGGYFEFLPVSYLPYAYGAGVSWCVETNKNIDIAHAADLYAFRDEAGVMGRFAYDIGNAHKKTGCVMANNTTYYMLLRFGVERPLSESSLGTMKVEDLQATIAYLDETLARLDQTKMDRDDAELIKAGYRMNVAMAKAACRVGIARLNSGGVEATSKLSKGAGAPVADELEALIPDYRQLWLARDRSGGLKESVGNIESLIAILRN